MPVIIMPVIIMPVYVCHLVKKKKKYESFTKQLEHVSKLIKISTFRILAISIKNSCIRIIIPVSGNTCIIRVAIKNNAE